MVENPKIKLVLSSPLNSKVMLLAQSVDICSFKKLCNFYYLTHLSHMFSPDIEELCEEAGLIAGRLQRGAPILKTQRQMLGFSQARSG